jgi:hypothetical protein
MTAVTTPIDAAEQLLQRLLAGGAADRIIVHGEILNSEQLGGLTVVDDHCADTRGQPLVLPLAKVWRHLQRTGPHDPATVRLGSRDDGGYGPAFGPGGTA